MANEVKRVFGTQTQLQSAGASVSNNAISAAAATTYDLSASGGDYAHARFTLRVNSSVALTANAPITLILRALNVQGTNDTPVPTTSYLNRPAGVFSPIAQTADQYLELYAYDLPREFEAYIYNQAGQSLTSWDLWVQPFSYAPT